jgi:hypothetical protein
MDAARGRTPRMGYKLKREKQESEGNGVRKFLRESNQRTGSPIHADPA